MKRIIVFSLLLVILALGHITQASAQESPSMDHIALYVFDLDKSAEFYKNVMKFEVIPEPFHDDKHVWFRIGSHSKLHIIKGAASVTDHDINSHFAYHVTDLKKFMQHLDKLKVKYGNWAGDEKATQARPDGVTQIYLKDPDNYWIEVNDDKS